MSLTICNQKRANNPIKSNKTGLRNVCTCKTAFPNLIDPAIGHVRGMGGEISSDNGTKLCLNRGLNYRPLEDPLNIDEAMSTIKEFWEAIEGYAASLLESDKDVLAAKRRFLSYCKATIKAKQHKLKNKVTAKRVNTDSIAFAQKHLALTKVDKAANTIAWECIYYHQQNLWARATTGENFIKLNFTLTEAKHHLVDTVKSHTRLWLKPELIPTALAYLTSTIKFHKEPIAYRYITPMHNCPLAPITKLLGAALQYLLKNTWADLCHQGELYILQEHGVRARLNWRVESMNDFMLNLPPNTTSLWGCDIDQCYENHHYSQGAVTLCMSQSSGLLVNATSMKLTPNSAPSTYGSKSSKGTLSRINLSTS